MVLKIDGNNFCLEEITAKDLRFSNLAGRLTGSQYDDPNRPKHEYVVWLRDPDIIAAIAGMGLHVSEVSRQDGSVGYSLKLHVYPATRENRMTGKTEAYPKCIIKTPSTGKTRRLDVDEFGTADATKFDEVSIAGHVFYSEKCRMHLAAIDTFWLVADESAGELDRGYDPYLDEKYGYIDDDADPAEAEAAEV